MSLYPGMRAFLALQLLQQVNLVSEMSNATPYNLTDVHLRGLKTFVLCGALVFTGTNKWINDQDEIKPQKNRKSGSVAVNGRSIKSLHIHVLVQVTWLESELLAQCVNGPPQQDRTNDKMVNIWWNSVLCLKQELFYNPCVSAHLTFTSSDVHSPPAPFTVHNTPCPFLCLFGTKCCMNLPDKQSFGSQVASKFRSLQDQG